MQYIVYDVNASGQVKLFSKYHSTSNRKRLIETAEKEINYADKSYCWNYFVALFTNYLWLSFQLGIFLSTLSPFPLPKDPRQFAWSFFLSISTCFAPWHSLKPKAQKPWEDPLLQNPGCRLAFFEQVAIMAMMLFVLFVVLPFFFSSRPVQ